MNVLLAAVNEGTGPLTLGAIFTTIVGGVLRKGDVAILRCKKAWEWGTPQEAHGWDCKWAGKRQ